MLIIRFLNDKKWSTIQFSGKNEDIPNFDKILQDLWKKMEDHGICKYKLNLKCRSVNPLTGLVVQGCSQRVHNRRAPETFNSVNMPFDSNKFNFTKVSPSEILFQIHRKKENAASNSAKFDAEHFEDIIVINVSPFAFGHFLLVPKVRACRRQVLSRDLIELALEIQFLSDSLNFITVFNSMCGQASVNHLHMHGYYLNVPNIDKAKALFVQRLTFVERKLSDSCFVADSLPVPAFYFQVSRYSLIPKICEEIMKIVEYFVQRNIAHNVSIVKGDSVTFDGSMIDDADDDSIVHRFFLWPRLNQFDEKRNFRVNAGSCELSGHVFVLDDVYESVTQAELLSQIQSVALPTEEFEQIVDEVTLLLQK